MNYRNKKRREKVGLVLLALIAIAGSMVAVYSFRQLQQRQVRIEELEDEMREYEKELYIASYDLNAGEVINEEKVKKEIRYSDESADVYMTKEDFGKVLTVSLKEGNCIMRNMLACETESLREVMISEIDLSEHLQAGDRVDVRISFGNAEDYIVLSEKLLVLYGEKGEIVLRMSEEEILLLSSALYDCNRYRDTKLYLVKYPELQQTEQSGVNYIPNKDILEMLGRTGDAIQRSRLEERLEES